MVNPTIANPALKAAVLAEALPYLRRYAGQTILVKYGGHAMGNGEDGDPFARDIGLLKQVGINPIVVHGGGPQIGQMLQRLGIKSTFVDGLRVTDGETMEVVEMVLAGTINKQLVAAINAVGGCAVGLSGKDGGLIRARKLTRNGADLGFVGEPERIDDRVLATFRQSDIIPVIAPIGVGAGGETYNINADTVAGADRGRSPAAHRGRHSLRRHDPQSRDLSRRGRWRRRSRRHPGRTRAACNPARIVHGRRRHADPPRLG